MIGYRVSEGCGRKWHLNRKPSHLAEPLCLVNSDQYCPPLRRGMDSALVSHLHRAN